MAKRIVADDAKFSTKTVSGAGKVKNTVPVAPDIKDGDIYTAPVPRKYRGKDIEDEMLDDKGIIVAAAEQAVPDSAVAASEQPMLLAQADAAPLTPGSDPVKTEQMAASSSGSNAGWWWLGAGVVAAGAGVGAGLSGGGGGTNSVGSTTVSGTVTDGPVQGAKLYFDVNANGKYDEGTDTAVLDANNNQVVTDASGNFSFTVTGSGAGIKLVTHGGTDTVTDEAVTLDFSAPAGYSQINPITSAIAAYMEANPGSSAAQAEVAVESALGLPDLDYSTVNLADPPAGLPAADVLAAQQAVAILVTAAIIIEQSGTNADAFQYISANMGSGGSTDALVTAVQSEPSVDSSAAAQLVDTVAAVEAATSLDTIGDALNNIFFAELVTNGTLTVGQTVSGEIGLGNITGLDVTYQWQSSADGSSWTDIPGAAGSSYSLTQGESGDHIRLEAVYTDTAGIVQTVYSSDMGVVPISNVAPVITSNGGGATAAVTATENQTAVANVTSSDVDAGDGKSFSITGGADSALFAINSSTGALTFQSAPNYETPADAGADNVYDVQVTVTDTAGLTDVQDLAVTVTNANEAPVITSNGSGVSAAVNAAENLTVVTTVTSTDVDAGDGKSFSITGGADSALFAISSSTGALTFQSAPNYETPADAGADNVYDVQVTVTDTAGLTDVQDLAVTVTNANEAPVITSNGSGVSAAVNAAENLTVVTTVTSTDVDAGDGKSFSITGGADQALFTINSSTGALTFQSAPNYETPADAGADNVYDVQVTVTDTAGLTDVQDLAVTVTNANEAPVITSNGGGASAAVNATENQTVVTTVTSSDVDAGDGKTFTISGGADQALFAIDSTTGALTFQSAPNYEVPADSGADNVYDIQVTVTDTAGLADVQDLTVTVTNVNEHFVVEASGAWIDLNANGIKDAEDTTAADFTPDTGNVDLTAIPGIIHFNNVPSGDLSLSGFGVDDRIEIDVQAFIGNGHNALQILTRPNIKTLDQMITTGGGPDYTQTTVGRTLNGLLALGTGSGSTFNQTGTRYINSNSFITLTSTSTSTSNQTATIGLKLNEVLTGSRRLYFSTNNGSGISASSLQLATALPTNMTLQQMVDFVNPPTPPATVYVVVERNGAVIDFDGDGVRDNGENMLAVFAAGGSADLTGATPVIIHFNDAPQYALDLTGFSSDDKIEFDIQAMQLNSLLNTNTSPATAVSLLSITSVPSGVYYYLASHFGNTATYMSHPILVGQSSFTPAGYRSGISHSGAYGIFMFNIPNVSTRTGGYVAYWTDPGNALNNPNNILPGYTGTNTAAVLATLNSNAPHAGQVDFIWPVNVVVDDEAGNVAMFIDANANGVRDGGEVTLALLGQSADDVVAFNTAAGTSYDSQTVDLASEQVTIHYNDLPTGAWVPNLTGFGGNDRIQIDITSMRNNISVSDSSVLGSQTIRSISSSQIRVKAGVSGVTSGSTAVYVSGGNLKFGHTTLTTPTGTPITKFAAIGTLEGVIATNAGAIANNYQQVVFVTAAVI